MPNPMASSVTNVEWETNWSYRQQDVKDGAMNNAIYFQIVIFSLMLCIWAYVWMKSAKADKTEGKLFILRLQNRL
jgi:hypothetical protein